MKRWTIEEDLKLQQIVSTNLYPFKEIAKMMNRTRRSCHMHSIYLGLNTSYRPRRYSLNHDFWAIRNGLSCYWSGFSSADSSIQKKSEDNYRYRLEIGEKDLHHLERFVLDCQYTGKIGKIHRPSRIFNETRNIKESNTYAVAISSTKWGTDLRDNFNITPNKTYRFEPPDFKDDFLTYCWLVGYTDGDGCICFNTKAQLLNISFTSSSIKLLEFIKKFTDEKFPNKLSNKPRSITRKEVTNCFDYAIGGIRACVIIDKLRKLDIPKLARKWEKPEILEYIASQKLKYPEFFLDFNN